MKLARILFIAIVAFVALVIAIHKASATYKEEYALQPPEVQAWFKRAETTPAAEKRLTWKKCCDHSDRFKTKFLQGRTIEEWYYEKDGKWLLIPADVIHTESDPTMPAQLKAEGVLFIYPPVVGVPTCFWPPESGI